MSEYLQTRGEEIVSEYCKRNNVSDAFKSEVARVLLLLSPQSRIYLVEAINLADREDSDERMGAIKKRLKALDQADGLSATMKEMESEL